MTPETIALQHTPIITFGYVMQVIISLLVVLAFIYLAAKFILPKMKISTSGKLIKILDHIYLEPQVSAYILQVGKKAWLVVASSKNVEMISEIEVE
ncbi:MAG: flagellar biosynthetic protein FliO [Candidatus Margulisbacteria bacterium]|nr:flagellar biosynthetic protein FliO [Candidatus Margulisiibacteriota bacterium]